MLKNSEIRVIIADDSLIFRETITALLAQEPEITVVAVAGNWCEAYQLSKQHKPDIVLMDIKDA